MNNAELIDELRGHIREVPLTLLRDAADALEAADKRIAELEAQLPWDEWSPDWCTAMRLRTELREEIELYGIT